MDEKTDVWQGTLALMVLILAASLVGPAVKSAHASPQSASSTDVDLTNPDVVAIVRIAKDFSEAVAASDFKRMIDFYSPDVVYMSPGLPDAQGRDEVAQNWQGMLSTYNLHVEVHILEVKILGGYAYDRAIFTMSMKPKAGGETQEASGRLLEVLRKEEGKWKSLRVMVNSDR
jgi:uncharacterized protein (TIGR02246 family)